MSQNGKGSSPRPKSVDQKTWDKNYNRIFQKDSSTKESNIKDKSNNETRR
jgi:hypothetical protein